jgi:transcriptional regulator with XRE-family HTH domain
MTSEEIRTVNATNFRLAWQESGLTQDEFVRRMSECGARTDRSDFSRIKTGLLRLSEERLAALVNVTGRDLTWFFTDHSGNGNGNSNGV